MVDFLQIAYSHIYPNHVSNSSARVNSKPEPATKRLMYNQHKESSLFKTVVGGSGIGFAGIFFGYGLNLVFRMITARAYGTHGYGIFAIALAILLVVSKICMLGLDEAAARFIPYWRSNEQSEKIRAMFGLSIFTLGLTGIASGVLLYCSSQWLSRFMAGGDDLCIMLRVFAVGLPFVLFYTFGIAVFRGLKDMRGMIIAEDLILWLLNILLVALSVFFHLPLNVVAIIYIISTCLSTLYIFLRFQCNHDIKLKLYDMKPGKQHTHEYKELLHFSLPMLTASVTDILRQRSHVIVVGYYLGAMDVGIYSAALSVGILVQVFLKALNRIILPVASHLFGRGEQLSLSHLYKSSTKWILVLTLPIMFWMLSFPELILDNTFGPEFGHQGANILRIFSLGYFVNTITGPFGEYLRAFGKSPSIFWLSIIGGVLNLVLLIILIPTFGLPGAAFAVSGALVLVSFLGMFILYRLTQLHPFSWRYICLFLVGIICLCFLYVIVKKVDFLNSIHGIVLLTFIFLPLYFVVIYVLAMNANERKSISLAKSKLLQILRQRYA